MPILVRPVRFWKRGTERKAQGDLTGALGILYGGGDRGGRGGGCRLADFPRSRARMQYQKAQEKNF